MLATGKSAGAEIGRCPASSLCRAEGGRRGGGEGGFLWVITEQGSTHFHIRPRTNTALPQGHRPAGEPFSKGSRSHQACPPLIRSSSPHSALHSARLPTALSTCPQDRVRSLPLPSKLTMEQASS